MIHLQYHPHTVYVFRTNISESVPNRHHCLERYIPCSRQTVGICRRFFRLYFISSRHLCLRSSPTSVPAASVMLFTARSTATGRGRPHLQRPASDVFCPRFAEVRVVRAVPMIGELQAAVFQQFLNPVTVKFNFVSCCCCFPPAANAA